MITLEPKYGIGDSLYYATQGGAIGIVTDITYRLSSNIVWYHVTFNPSMGEVACRDFELTTEKMIEL